MFIGHFAIAFVLAWLFPGIPLWVFLVAVSFPDLLWSVLVPAHVEKVKIDPNSPLQKNIQFEKFPYSHSLLLTSLFAFITGILIGFQYGNPIIIGVLFTAGSASHWLLDTVVHIKDLPMLGFSSSDKKIGLGLWNYGPIAFTAELIFYLTFAVAFVSATSLTYALALGIILHLVNANSFLGFTKRNPIASSNAYAALAFLGFGLFIAIGYLILQSFQLPQ